MNASSSNRIHALMAGAVLAPFFLNDFAFLKVETLALWLGVDYGSRALVLAVIFAYPPFRAAAIEALGLNKPDSHPLWPHLGTLGLAGLAAAALALGSEFAIRLPLLDVLPDTALFTYPDVDFGPVYWLDITAGLVLVAVSEELACRTVMRRALEKVTDSPIVIIAVSAVVFGLIHWSNGIPNIVNATVIGAVFMAAYLRCGTILPLIAAHYVIDIYYFA